MPRAKCIAFVNHKGGTGKTTSCLSIAGYLAKSGNKVLVVDFDPQASATLGLGIDPMTVEYSVYDAILGQCDGYEGVPMTRLILETKVENLHCAPSQFDLAIAEALMLKNKRRATMLNRILEEVRPLYDYILIDLPPGSGLLTINGLCAADQVVVPLEPSIYSLEVLHNLKTAFCDIKQMTGHSINHVSCVLTRYVKPNALSGMLINHNASKEIETRLRKMFQTVFLVPESARIYEAQLESLPISHYAPKSRVGKAYAEIATALGNNGKKKSGMNKLEAIKEEAK
ncbi:MAG: AAA family ATPase [Dehalococcoidia bacterium]|nr:AAA family ATPase [Dehalococcoidia bacterium]